MTDLATLGIKIDSSQVKTGVSDLDKLTAAGARAEAATVGLGGGIKGAGVQAAAMATAAQASARAAMDQAAGFKVSASAARVNTLAMRETLVVARELARGNFTRIPGSLSLLAQGIGSQGGFSSFISALSQQLGLIKKVQDAELAEQAVAAANAAAAVQGAAEKAAANVIAADTEIALAEAQVRVTAGTSAEAAAQVRLAEAHQAVAAAAGEAAIAEDALAVAQERANVAANASKAATRTVIGTGGAGLIGIGIAATAAALAFEALKDHVRDTGVLNDFANSLGLSAKQMADLKEKTNDFALTFGDVWNGIKKTAEDALFDSSGWKEFRKNSDEAFTGALQGAINFAATMQGTILAAKQTIISDWKQFPAAFGDIFFSAVNKAIDALNSLVKHGTDLLNGFIQKANQIPGINIGQVNAPQIGNVTNPYAGSADKVTKDFAANVAKDTAAARATIDKNLRTLYGNIIGAAEDRIKKEAPNPPKGREQREKRNPADDELAKLDAQIAGQNALAQAYLTSDAAVIKAQADEKAMVLAVEKHANVAQTAALKSKELALAIATVSAEGAKQINNLAFEASSRKQVNDEIQAGLIPASQAGAQLQLESELRPLIAAQSLAEGAAKERLTGEIERLTKAYADNQAQISRGQALQTIAANDNEAAKLRLEATLLGASNRERAVALAQLEAVQQLKDMPGLSPEDQANFVNSAVNRALAGVTTPFQEWAKSVPQTADAITEALQGIETHGFDMLASSITDVITGAKSLKEAFRDTAQSIISEILQMIIKMLIFRALSSIFGGAFGGGGGGIPSASPTFGSANGNIFSGGNVIPFATGGIVTGPTLFPMSGGRTGLMGEAGPEGVLPLARDGHGRLGVRANDNGPLQLELTVSMGPAPDFALYVDQVASTRAGQAVQVSVRHTNDTVRKIGRPKMMGGG